MWPWDLDISWTNMLCTSLHAYHVLFYVCCITSHGHIWIEAESLRQVTNKSSTAATLTRPALGTPSDTVYHARAVNIYFIIFLLKFQVIINIYKPASCLLKHDFHTSHESFFSIRALLLRSFLLEFTIPVFRWAIAVGSISIHTADVWAPSKRTFTSSSLPSTSGSLIGKISGHRCPSASLAFLLTFFFFVGGSSSGSPSCGWSAISNASSHASCLLCTTSSQYEQLTLPVSFSFEDALKSRLLPVTHLMKPLSHLFNWKKRCSSTTFCLGHQVWLPHLTMSCVSSVKSMAHQARESAMWNAARSMFDWALWHAFHFEKDCLPHWVWHLWCGMQLMIMSSPATHDHMVQQTYMNVFMSSCYLHHESLHAPFCNLFTLHRLQVVISQKPLLLAMSACMCIMLLTSYAASWQEKSSGLWVEHASSRQISGACRPHPLLWCSEDMG